MGIVLKRLCRVTRRIISGQSRRAPNPDVAFSGVFSVGHPEWILHGPEFAGSWDPKRLLEHSIR